MIITVPNSILNTPAKKVIKIDKKVLHIVDQMKKTLVGTNNPKGVGLAAPQIGIPLRLFITRPTQGSPIDVFINPEITWYSPEVSEIQRPKDSKPSVKKDKKLEGCLSIPNVWGNIKRPNKVKLRFMNLHGETYEKAFNGFMATIIQHETDHLNGILFTHRVLEQKEKFFRIEKDTEGKEALVEIEL